MSQVLRWTARKTRKPHRCVGCGKEYPAKTRMVSAAYKDGGSVFDCYWCPTCVEYVERYFKPGDEISKAEIYENDPEGWEALRAELGHACGED